jgi:predicted Zn-dependent protease with MMP-like domain
MVLDLAEDALNRGDASEALELCGQILKGMPEHPGALYLTGEAFRDMRELHEAELRYRRVVHLLAIHSPSWSALGAVLFEQLRFQEARAPLLRAIRLDPLNAEAYYWRAMLRERRGDYRGAARDFRRASHLNPVAFPRPVPLDDSTVEAVVIEVLQELHPSIRGYLAQVTIILEEVPEEDVLRQYHPPAPPSEILGYFAGVPVTERSLEDPWSHLPSAIVLFRRNLERVAWDRERLIEELRITVFHEVGHFLGLDEQDLEARGLD